MAITAVVATCGCRSLFPCVLRFIARHQCITPLRCITRLRLRPWSAILHRCTATCGAKFVTTDIIDTVMAVTAIVIKTRRE